MEERSDTASRVNAFKLDETYLLRHYFDGDAVFATLRPYYNNQQYRFEIPTRVFHDIQTFLHECGYRLVIVNDLTEFVIVVRKYTSHPENVFKAAVHQWSVGEFNCFLMKDRDAVATAVDHGARRLNETPLEHELDQDQREILGEHVRS